MTFKHNDENRERENYSWPTKTPFTYLSGSERAELTSCFLEMLSSHLEDVYLIGSLISALSFVISIVKVSHSV